MISPLYIAFMVPSMLFITIIVIALVHKFVIGQPQVRFNQSIYPRNYIFPSNYRVYSEVLLSEVNLCCHKTAQLNDLYCICGKGILYTNRMFDQAKLTCTTNL